MSNTGDVHELEDLEPLEEAAVIEQTTVVAGSPAAAEAALGGTRGLPPPALSMTAHREYYRFLFGGVVIVLGCLMPFGPEWEQAGYKTLSGALFMLIGIGMVWSMWGAIHTGRFAMKWILLATLPFLIELLNLIFAFKEPAVAAWVEAAKVNPDFHMPADWPDVFARIGGSFRIGAKDPSNAAAVDNFFRAFGTGKLVVLLGALWTEVWLMLAIFGGVKAAKQQKGARSSAAAERRKR